MSDIIIPGQPRTAPEKPTIEATPVMQIAVHVARDIQSKLETELKAYIARHKIPAGEVRVAVSGKAGALQIMMSHQQNGLRIIGTPVRRLRIKWGVE